MLARFYDQMSSRPKQALIGKRAVDTIIPYIENERKTIVKARGDGTEVAGRVAECNHQAAQFRINQFSEMFLVPPFPKCIKRTLNWREKERKIEGGGSAVQRGWI